MIFENLIIEKINIVGRGEIFLIDLIENKITDPIFKIGDKIKHSGKIYSIKGIECSRNLLNNKISRIGLNVRLYE